MQQIGVFHCADPKSIDGQGIQKAYNLEELFGLQNANKIIQVSKFYKDEFQKTFPDLDKKSVYIPNGININEWKNKRKIELPGKNKIKVIYIGRFSREKNILELINAQIPSNIDLIFVGNLESGMPHLIQEFKNKLETKENIYHIGPKFGQEKIDILYSADAVILPSLQECNPIVMYEALISESIFISSFVGDIKNILNEKVGIDCGTNKFSIQKALRELSVMNQKERQTRIQKGLKIVQNYTWEKSAEKTAEVYMELLNRAN